MGESTYYVNYAQYFRRVCAEWSVSGNGLFTWQAGWSGGKWSAQRGVECGVKCGVE